MGPQAQIRRTTAQSFSTGHFRPRLETDSRPNLWQARDPQFQILRRLVAEGRSPASSCHRPRSSSQAQAHLFVPTDLHLKPALLIQRFSWRWPLEQLFADVKTWLGLNSAEVRAPKSVLSHALFSFALVTWVRIWAAKHLSDHQHPPISFLGQLSMLRTNLLTETIFSSIPPQRLSKQNCRDLASLMLS